MQRRASQAYGQHLVMYAEFGHTVCCHCHALLTTFLILCLLVHLPPLRPLWSWLDANPAAGAACLLHFAFLVSHSVMVQAMSRK